MNATRVFSNLENANAILNGQEDCCDEFVEAFVSLHKEPIDNVYMYEWLIRSFVDVIKVNQSVLYIACGTAGYTRLFKNVKRFVGIDFSKKMISAAKELNQNPAIDFDFNCTTFEDFNSTETFDIIYLGPYGHNVPYTIDVLQKAKKYLKKDGMLFCTIGDPGFKNIYSRFKEFSKQLILHGNVSYDPIAKLEKMFCKTNLQVHCQLKMKTSIGSAVCYVLKG